MSEYYVDPRELLMAAEQEKQRLREEYEREYLKYRMLLAAQGKARDPFNTEDDAGENDMSEPVSMKAPEMPAFMKKELAEKMLALSLEKLGGSLEQVADKRAAAKPDNDRDEKIKDFVKERNEITIQYSSKHSMFAACK